MAPVGEDEPKPQIILDLEKLDDKYLELKKQYDKEVAALAKKYTEKQKPFLDKRSEALSKGNDATSGTPACEKFWLQAMSNVTELGHMIEEHDKDVLRYLKDIVTEDLDDEDPEKGYRLKFFFVENPYFEQTELNVEWHYGETNAYNGETEITKMVATDIDWKDGKNVTVEKTVKKVKGGGAKKAKQKGKETIEPRESFFRLLFRTLDLKGDAPDDLALYADPEEEMDDEDAVEMFMGQTDEIGCQIKDSLIPFAVRWYTGEAKTDDDDDDDDDEDSEEEDDDDDDDETESDEEEEPKGKKGGKKPVAGKKDKEECKQQ